MAEIGHFNRLQSLISGLAQRGIAAHVFTHRQFEPQVSRAGGIFFDLFLKYPLEEADDTSFPVPCRFVSFAGRYGKQKGGHRPYYEEWSGCMWYDSLL
jgi:hypothetical protein